MTTQVCILGIDGSGKSTVAACLPRLLAAELDLRAGSAGEGFLLTAPDEDHLAPNFVPDGLAISARLSRRLKRRAKKLVNNRRLYPAVKLAQILFQDSAAKWLARRYRADVVVSDGNAVLSVSGRMSNYRRAASDGDDRALPAPGAEDLAAAFGHILGGKPVPQESADKLPPLRRGRKILKLCRLLRIRAGWLPDVVVFLDLSPKAALERIKSRGQGIDRHENEADLAQARSMYLTALEAFKMHDPGGHVLHIPADDRSPGDILRAAMEGLRPLLDRHAGSGRANGDPLGTTKTELTEGSIWSKVFNARYIGKYLIGNVHRGAWRELVFPFSARGKLFLREGYSAGVMRVIYDQHEERIGWSDRVFLEYPLHRAVYDRLGILTSEIERELKTRLSEGGDLHIITAPSGFAYDIFRPLEAIVGEDPAAARRIHLRAADLDPHEVLAAELNKRAEALGIDFSFFRGDITNEDFRTQLRGGETFDLALFVGLSSWLPKPPLVRHLKWLRNLINKDGVLVTDCFTPHAYALSGRYVGYKAHYYAPDVYRMLLDACGFDGLKASVTSGRDAINHVVLSPPRPLAQQQPHESVANDA